MKKTIEIEGRPIAVKISAAAAQALSKRDTQLVAEMELLFSCLIAKYVRFNEVNAPVNGVAVTDNLTVCFSAMMSQSCDIAGSRDFETETFAVKNSHRYVPHWLEIDYRSGEWQGEFGYST